MGISKEPMRRYEVLLTHVPIIVCNLCIASCKLIGMNPGNINTFAVKYDKNSGPYESPKLS